MNSTVFLKNVSLNPLDSMITRMHSSRMCTIRSSGHLPGDVCLGDVYPWVSALGGICTGGVCLGGVCPEGVFTQRGCLPRAGVSTMGRCLPGGVCLGMSAQGNVCPGGCLPRGCLPKEGCVSQHALGQTPHCGQNDRQVWKQFLSATSFVDGKKYLSLEGLQPATFCVRNQGATMTPARHVWDKIFKLS